MHATHTMYLYSTDKERGSPRRHGSVASRGSNCCHGSLGIRENDPAKHAEWKGILWGKLESTQLIINLTML